MLSILGTTLLVLSVYAWYWCFICLSICHWEVRKELSVFAVMRKTLVIWNIHCNIRRICRLCHRRRHSRYHPSCCCHSYSRHQCCRCRRRRRRCRHRRPYTVRKKSNSFIFCCLVEAIILSVIECVPSLSGDGRTLTRAEPSIFNSLPFTRKIWLIIFSC